MDGRDITRTKQLLRGVLAIAAATEQPPERILDRVMPEPPRKGPTRATALRLIAGVKTA